MVFNIKIRKRMKVKIIGAFGSRLANKFSSCFLINDKIAIDAGNLSLIGKKANFVNHIFITHSHLDHILDIPFVIAELYPIRKVPLKIYGSNFTIRSLKKFIFNNRIWPDFTKIKIIKSLQCSLEFHEIKEGDKIKIENFEITPFSSNHIIPTFGYKILEKNKSSILISGDTWKQENIWKMANEDNLVKAIFIDVSFPKKFKKLAFQTKHLSTGDLEEEIKLKLKRKNISVFAYHIKPLFFNEVEKEIKMIRKKVYPKVKYVKQGDVYTF